MYNINFLYRSSEGESKKPAKTVDESNYFP